MTIIDQVLAGQLQPQKLEVGKYEITPKTLFHHPTSISIDCVAATKCMRWLITGSSDGHVRKFDFFKGMNGHGKVTQAQLQGFPDTLTNGIDAFNSWSHKELGGSDDSDDEAVQQGGAKKNAPVSTSKSQVFSLAVQQQALWVLAGHQNGSIQLYTARHDAGTLVHSLKQHSAAASVLELLPDERRVLSGGWDKRILLWDLDTGKVVRDFGEHSSAITSVKLQPVGDEASPNVFLVTSFDGQTLAVWDVRQSEVVRNLQSDPSVVPPWCLSACWSPDGQRIFCGRRNEIVEEWDIGRGALVQYLNLPAQSGPVSCVRAMPNGKQIICGSFDNLRLWNLEPSPNAVVPFQIIPGHHGGTISDMCTLYRELCLLLTLV